MKASPAMLLSLALAALALAGTVAVALGTDVGSAPGSGQKTFDAPGCLPRAYDGPGRRGHYLLNRNCPTPSPVLIAKTIGRVRRGWLVELDASKSFDPMGGRLTEFSWALEPGPQRHGRTIRVEWPAGTHPVVLHVTNDSGLTGTLAETVSVP
ncbi:MAG TPA: hypothetical protein VKH20_01080 [Solirubrobacterales bacterium]|nr:hypothetical protein [Solirubrobacterales bacterium]